MNNIKYSQNLNGWAFLHALKSKYKERKTKVFFPHVKKSLCVFFCVTFLTVDLGPVTTLFGQTVNKFNITSQYAVIDKTVQTRIDKIKKGEDITSVLARTNILFHVYQCLDNRFYQTSENSPKTIEAEPEIINEEEPEEIETAISEEPIYETVSIQDVPNWESACKSYAFSYMAYTATTDWNSAQYQLLNSDRASSDEETGLRLIDDRFAIAVGTGWGLVIGDYIDVVMENGSIIPCIMGEAKDDKDTDASHRYHISDGSVVEMIVDNAYFSSTAQYPEELDGSVLELRHIIRQE